MGRTHGPELHRAAIDSLSDSLLVLVTADGRIAEWNADATTQTGIHRDEACARTARAALGEDIDGLLAAARGTSRAAGRITTRHANGQPVAIDVEVHTLTRAGAVIGFVVRAGSDVEQRLRTARSELDDATEALRQVEESFALVFRALPVAACIVEQDTGVFVDANPAFATVFARERDAIVARAVRDLGLWTTPSEGVDLQVARPRPTACTWHDPTGAELSFLHSSEPIMMHGKRCVLSALLDVTAHRNSERALRKAQKMEAVGRLAGGVAHDFNNLLAVVSSACFLLPEQVARGESIQPTIDVLHDALERGKGLTRQLLTVSRQQVVCPVVFDCNLHLRRATALLRHLLGEDIAVTADLAPGELPLRMDLSQFEQIVLNLAANARDAMPSGGHFTIRTQVVDVAARTPQEGENSLTGKHALITIADDGVGMAPHVRAHAFEPFFTTKRAGNGTGLGLAVVHGIVMQSGGCIEVDSAPGAGTTFRMLFPLVPTEQLHEPMAAPVTEAPHGSETVLVVEDDDSVRNLICGTLRALGYAVLQAPDGPAALASFPAERDRVQLLLTDAVMPTMAGREVAAALRARPPPRCRLHERLRRRPARPPRRARRTIGLPAEAVHDGRPRRDRAQSARRTWQRARAHRQSSRLITCQPNGLLMRW